MTHGKSSTETWCLQAIVRCINPEVDTIVSCARIEFGVFVMKITFCLISTAITVDG